ncbi:MAG: MFS transporter [Jatrophihabitans sp.]
MPTVDPPQPQLRRGLLVVAIVLTGFSMRTAVTSIGSVLERLQDGLGATGAGAGLITTLPVLCFAAVGSFAPRLNRRFGPNRVLVVAMVAATAGLATRALAGSLWLFALLSILALTGGAISNVSMPSLVKSYFPDRLGAMTAVYTTALAIGATAAAGLTVPISDLSSGADSWRLGIGSWALFTAVAVLPWLPMVRRRDASSGPVRAIPVRALIGSRTAWALTIFFAFQSFQAYIAFGWFARFFEDHGVSDGGAGGLVAYYSALSIPISMVVPALAVRGQRRIILSLGACYAVGYAGLIIAPVGGAWLWLILIGIGSGAFPVALTMIGLHTRHIEVTAAVSAFVQSVGYVLAGSGPLLVGALIGATHSWTGPFIALYVALAVSTGAGVIAARDTTVDQEIESRRRSLAAQISG